MELVITANGGTEGNLFGSVGPIDITEACEKVGDFAVGLHFHGVTDRYID